MVEGHIRDLAIIRLWVLYVGWAKAKMTVMRDVKSDRLSHHSLICWNGGGDKAAAKNAGLVFS